MGCRVSLGVWTLRCVALSCPRCLDSRTLLVALAVAAAASCGLVVAPSLGKAPLGPAAATSELEHRGQLGRHRSGRRRRPDLLGHESVDQHQQLRREYPVQRHQLRQHRRHVHAQRQRRRPGRQYRRLRHEHADDRSQPALQQDVNLSSAGGNLVIGGIVSGGNSITVLVRRHDPDGVENVRGRHDDQWRHAPGRHRRHGPALFKRTASRVLKVTLA